MYFDQWLYVYTKEILLFATLSHFSNGTELAGPFEQLPSRRELPDYYEVIEKPMDLNKVKRKIKDGKYHCVQDMGDDIRLLCANARVRLTSRETNRHIYR